MSGMGLVQTDTITPELETFSHRISGHNFMVQFPRGTTMLRVYTLMKQSVEKVLGEGKVPYSEFQVIVEKIWSVFQQNDEVPFVRPQPEWEDNLGNSSVRPPPHEHNEESAPEYPELERE